MPPNRRRADVDELRKLLDPTRSLFEVLGADPKSTPRELSVLRNIAARVAHPDLWTDHSAEIGQLAHDAMSLVNHAYATLTDAAARRRYFMLDLPKTHAPCPACAGVGEVPGKRRGFTITAAVACPTCQGACYFPKSTTE